MDSQLQLQVWLSALRALSIPLNGFNNIPDCVRHACYNLLSIPLNGFWVQVMVGGWVWRYPLSIPLNGFSTVPPAPWLADMDEAWLSIPLNGFPKYIFMVEDIVVAPLSLSIPLNGFKSISSRGPAHPACSVFQFH